LFLGNDTLLYERLPEETVSTRVRRFSTHVCS
jgi:hypothetical protein